MSSNSILITVRHNLSEPQLTGIPAIRHISARNRLFPMHFTPLIWKSRCLTLTQKFRNGYVKSIEKKAKKKAKINRKKAKFESQFLMHNEQNSGRTCRTQLVLPYTSFSRLISFGNYTSISILIGSANRPKTEYFIHSCSTRSLHTVFPIGNSSMSVFFLLTSECVSLLHCTSSPLFTSLAFALEFCSLWFQFPLSGYLTNPT